ncbi:hypothetical protein BX598_0382 [Micrococcaceae bacterium JKS001869]|nr:hypothetical protein BX598_0382 [Micrococcaceae bacterium JKS001869]
MTDDQTSTPATRPVGRFEWEAVFRSTPVTPVSVKALGLTLATYANTRTGTDIRPGVARLAADLGTSPRTIITGLGELERAGFLECVRRGSTYGRGGKGMASVYRLTLPVGATADAEAEPEQVKHASPDVQQVKQASPDVDNHPAAPPEQVKADAGTGESPRGSGENPGRSGEAGFTRACQLVCVSGVVTGRG